MSKAKPVGGGPDDATVLLVEDEPKVAAFIRKGLRRAGFQVHWVATGQEALARLEEGGVDVQILDLGLPDIDGLEVLGRMRHQGIDVPVIVVTGRSDPLDQATASSFGVRAYLKKPFAWSELLAAVRGAVGQVPSRGEGDMRSLPDRG